MWQVHSHLGSRRSGRGFLAEMVLPTGRRR